MTPFNPKSALRLSLVFSAFAMAGFGAVAQEAPTRSDFVSDASFVVGTYKPMASDHSPASMATAAKAFLSALDAEQRRLVLHDLKGEERTRWTNLPQRENGGLRLGACRPDQVRAFCDLLAALLSEQGYQKSRDIMIADDQLLRGGRPRTGFGVEDFYVVLFGEPSATKRTT